MKKYALYILCIAFSCGASDKKSAGKQAAAKSIEKQVVKKDAKNKQSADPNTNPSLSVMRKFKRFGVINGYGYCD